jgi:hypothetical protein
VLVLLAPILSGNFSRNFTVRDRRQLTPPSGSLLVEVELASFGASVESALKKPISARTCRSPVPDRRQFRLPLIAGCVAGYGLWSLPSAVYMYA